jgi:hypothetical protein
VFLLASRISSADRRVNQEKFSTNSGGLSRAILTTTGVGRFQLPVVERRNREQQQEMERPNDGERDSSNDVEPPVMSPSRKRSRAPIITTSNADPDSDDDSDYCTDASRSPYSLSPCPSPKRWGEKCFETPPVRRKFVHEKVEEENVEIFPTPATPSTNLIKMRIWQRSNYLDLIDLTLICTTPSHRYFGDNNIVDRPCPTCGLLINANAFNFEVSLNSSLPLFLLLSLDTL